jgi:hypothetical protein
MRRETGSALIITVLILLLLGVIGLNALDTVTRDQQVAGFQNSASVALYAAEAGVSEAKSLVATALDTTATFVFPDLATPGLLADTTLYPNGQPEYYGDPNVAKAIEPLNATLSTPGAGGTNMRVGAGANFGKSALWRIRVEGQSPGGSKSKIEVVATSPITSGYQ